MEQYEFEYDEELDNDNEISIDSNNYFYDDQVQNIKYSYKFTKDNFLKITINIFESEYATYIDIENLEELEEKLLVKMEMIHQKDYYIMEEARQEHINNFKTHIQQILSIDFVNEYCKGTNMKSARKQ